MAYREAFSDDLGRACCFVDLKMDLEGLERLIGGESSCIK